MMSTAENGGIMCEEPSLRLNGGDASHTETECIGEVIADDIEQNNEEKLTSQLSSTFIGHEEACEDKVMLLKQSSIAEEKDEVYAANKSEEAQQASIASSKKGLSIIDEDKEMEVDMPSSSKKMCAVDEIAEEGTETEKTSEMDIAKETVEEGRETQNLNDTSSKMEVSTTNKAVEEDIENSKPSSCKEMCTLDEIVDKGAVTDNANIVSTKNEMNSAEEAVDEHTETQSLRTVSSKMEVSFINEVEEKGTEVDKQSSSKEICAVEEAMEESTESDNVNIAPTENDINTAEESTETQNLSVTSFSKEMCTVDEVFEKGKEADNLNVASSKSDLNISEKTVEKGPEKTQNSITAPPKMEVSSKDEAVEERIEAQNLNAVVFKMEVSTPYEAVETTEEGTEEPEAQNLNAASSMSTVDEAVEGRIDAHDLSIGPSKEEMSSTVEAVEKGTEAQNLNIAPSKMVESTSEEAVAEDSQHLKTQNLNAAPAKKEKSTIEEVVKKMIRSRNLGIAPTKRKIMSGEGAVEERKEADGASISNCKQEMNIADEENNLNACGPSRNICTTVRAIEENEEESKASTSTLSSSSSGPNSSALRNIPRRNTAVRGRLSFNSRRILMNRRARLSEGLHFAFNGKTIAPKLPRISAPRVHVTAEAFPSLASELYSVLPETFKNAVSLSMMEYYLMILYYHRLAGLRMNRRSPLPEDEVLCSNLELGPLFVPDMIEQWITMRGHDVNTRGETIRLILPPLPSDSGDFGRLSATTHWRYISDLAPRVFRDRIAADLQHTLSSGPEEWDLPEDIRPQEKNCGLPTRNLIGYHVAQKLTASQIDELLLCGIGLWNDKTVFPIDVDAECYHLNIHLVEAVSQHFATLGSQFRIVRHARYDSQSSSAGLIVYGERMVSETEEYLFDRNVSHYEQKAKVRAYAPIAMDKELAKGAVVFLPRVYRRDGKLPINRSWCAYDFGFYFMVPDEWTATRNNAYKQGSWQSWHTPCLTTAPIMRANLLKAVVKRLVLSQEQTS